MTVKASLQHVSTGVQARVRLGPSTLPREGRPNLSLLCLSAAGTYPNDGGFQGVTTMGPVPPRRAYWLGGNWPMGCAIPSICADRPLSRPGVAPGPVAPKGSSVGLLAGADQLLVFGSAGDEASHGSRLARVPLHHSTAEVVVGGAMPLDHRAFVEADILGHEQNDTPMKFGKEVQHVASPHRDVQQNKLLG